MRFKEDEIIFLLGAGSSADAGIPVSKEMIEKVEDLIKNNENWQKYNPIYNYLKSSIIYSDGLRGVFGKNVNFNIERLVNVLYELEKKEVHPIYPFIGQWNTKFIEFDFTKFGKFRNLIVDQLKNWITLKDYSSASYLSKFSEFKNSYSHFLKIFTLNYDLCLEKNVKKRKIERGFDEKRIWKYRKFDNSNIEADIFLYKMHGSVDWERDEVTGKILYSDEVVKIKQPDLIFGTNYKLQYVDPYLFFTSEFRKHSLDAKIIVIIGYGFVDEHINGIISQALKSNTNRKIFCVGKNIDEDYIKKQLSIENTTQISVKENSAKDFFTKELEIELFEQLFPNDKDEVFF